MPRPCPRTVDAPIKVLGLELDDWAVVSSVLMFFLIFWTPVVALGAGVPVFVGLRLVKRGQPPGIVLHRLWAWGVLGLPGFPPAPPPEGRVWSPWA